MILLCAVAHAEAPAVLGVVYGLSVDGEPIGTREITVRYEGEVMGERIRIVEAVTEVAGGRSKKDRFTFQERMTANSHEGFPASFHAVTEVNGDPREVQARFGEGVWRVMLATSAGGRETSTVSAGDIDLSSVDLVDPESQRRLADYGHVQILSADLGRVLAGDVVALGPRDITVGGEVIPTDGFELRTAEGSWRYWYASNGFLLRYEEPRLGLAVVGTMIGSAPRAVDEFQVPGRPVVEELPLP